MAEYLRAIPASLPEAPRAILLVSAHWETDGFAFTGAERPELIYDYYGFPPHTYELTYPAPGDPGLATRAAELLRGAGLKAGVDATRGWDHGVFVPLKVAFPDATIPIVEMSLDASLDPTLHLAAGAALVPLRDEGVLIIGSGMSYHNMRGFGDPRSLAPSRAFDADLTATVTATPAERAVRFSSWDQMASARDIHPREEHLIPLLVAAGAGGAGTKTFSGVAMETLVSGFMFE
jgi:aromatic ring-opening dioxygenase catalytic subunit (LigB family)